MVKKKRKATPRQLANLARGRKILLKNQLRKMGANLNPKPQIIREVIREPTVNQVTNHQHNVKVQLSLFNKLLETKLFTLEVNKNKENLNFYEIINHIYSKLNNQKVKIVSNEQNIQQIIDFINLREKETQERFQKIEDEIEKLKKENLELKKKIKENDN